MDLLINEKVYLSDIHLSDSLVNFSTYVPGFKGESSMTEERKKKVSQMVYEKDYSIEKFKTMVLQEVIFAYNTAVFLMRKAEKDSPEYENFKKAKDVYFRLIVERVKNEEPEFYIAESGYTRYPFVGKSPSGKYHVWIFSQERYALFAKEHFVEQKVELNIKCLKHKEFLAFCAYLHIIGANAIFIDNGAYSIEIPLELIVPQPDFEMLPEVNRPVMNPDFAIRALFFLQELRRPISNDIKRELEEDMLKQLPKCKFLMPSQADREQLELIRQDPSVKRELRFKFPRLNRPDGKMYFPVFTDLHEYKKFEKGKEFGVLVQDYNGVVNIFKKGDSEGITINPFGMNIVINQKTIDAIDKLCGNVVTE